ncbi:MAG: hypothetical protein HY210_07885 [Candidatus Omnitrophica bacterium]|nr:hypothetical protein [Candidatus Omnitrophota bacterium]
MNKLTEKVIYQIQRDIFTDRDLVNLIGESADSRYGLVKRACASQEIVRVKRGLYCLAPPYQRQTLNLYQLAQNIYGPSYVSMESALSYHGWIPEAVHSVTMACMKKSKDFVTPLGAFNFKRIPVTVFYSEVDRVSSDNGEAFLMAKPLKALTDYVYAHKQDWKGLDPVINSLRIEPDSLEGISKEELDSLHGEYQSKRVERFIKGLKKDLQL